MPSLAADLAAIEAAAREALDAFDVRAPHKTLPSISRGLTRVRQLRQAVAASTLSAGPKAELAWRLDRKAGDFEKALALAQGTGGARARRRRQRRAGPDVRRSRAGLQHRPGTDVARRRGSARARRLDGAACRRRTRAARVQPIGVARVQRHGRFRRAIHAAVLEDTAGRRSVRDRTSRAPHAALEPARRDRHRPLHSRRRVGHPRRSGRTIGTTDRGSAARSRRSSTSSRFCRWRSRPTSASSRSRPADGRASSA